jgi:hypothetical protein
MFFSCQRGRSLVTNMSQRISQNTVVVDALIEGLRISTKTLNQKCKLALLFFGRRAGLRLRAVADDPDTSAAHRRRLEEVLVERERSSVINVGARRCLLDALLESLRVTNKRLNKKAIAAFGTQPPSSFGVLVEEATLNQDEDVGYCGRLLRAANEVDRIPDIIQHLELMGLMASRDKTVRQLASDLVQKFLLSRAKSKG